MQLSLMHAGTTTACRYRRSSRQYRCACGVRHAAVRRWALSLEAEAVSRMQLLPPDQPPRHPPARRLLLPSVSAALRDCRGADVIPTHGCYDVTPTPTPLDQQLPPPCHCTDCGRCHAVSVCIGTWLQHRAISCPPPFKGSSATAASRRRSCGSFARTPKKKPSSGRSGERQSA